jgi:hypothetical protein
VIIVCVVIGMGCARRVFVRCTALGQILSLIVAPLLSSTHNYGLSFIKFHSSIGHPQVG